MTVHRVTDKNTIRHLFADRHDACIWSCLQDCMGEAYSDHPTEPQAAAIFVAGFCFFAGKANLELVQTKPIDCREEYMIMIPPSPEWERMIKEDYKDRATRRMRYTTKKDPSTFDRDKLAQIVANLAAEYELRPIDRELYETILTLPWAWDLCGNIPGGYENFAANALGFVILHDGEIVSGASTYAYYRGGIEIQIDTREDYRRRGLATICGAKLILECLARGLYPSWDAHNPESLALAQKLGYVFDEEYVSYEIYPYCGYLND